MPPPRQTLLKQSTYGRLFSTPGFETGGMTCIIAEVRYGVPKFLDNGNIKLLSDQVIRKRYGYCYTLLPPPLLPPYSYFRRSAMQKLRVFSAQYNKTTRLSVNPLISPQYYHITPLFVTPFVHTSFEASKFPKYPGLRYDYPQSPGWACHVCKILPLVLLSPPSISPPVRNHPPWKMQ